MGPKQSSLPIGVPDSGARDDVGRAPSTSPIGTPNSGPRAQLLHALSNATASVDQLAMSLKLRMHQYQVVRGIELALTNHQKEMAERAIASLGK